MAKRITKEQLVEPNVFSDLIKEAGLLKAALETDVEALKRMLEVQKLLVESNPFNKGEDLKAFANQSANAQKTLKNLADTQKQLTALQREEAKLEQEIAKHTIASERAKQAQLRTQKLVNDQTKQSTKAVEKELDAYQKLNKTLNENRQKVKSLLAENRALTQSEVDLVNETQRLDMQLKTIDKQVGQSQRFVGEYERGWNGLGNSINQLSREMPAFANSVSTGFMAISNNLPTLFDEISKLRVENAKLIEQGKPAKSIFKQLGAALFSWQTALSVGVVLLTVYGKDIVEFIGSLFEAKKAFDASASSAEAMNKALESDSVGDSIAEYEELQIKVNQASKGLYDKKQVLEEYNETIGLTNGEVKTFTELEREIVEGKAAYIDAIVKRTAANDLLAQSAKMTLEKVEKDRKLINGGDDIGWWDRFLYGGNERQLSQVAKTRRKRLSDEAFALERDIQLLNEQAAKLLEGNFEKELEKQQTKTKTDSEDRLKGKELEVTKYSEFVKQQMSVLELELRRSGETEIEIQKRITNEKLKWILFEIEAKRKLNQDTTELELEAFKLTKTNSEKTVELRDKQYESEREKREKNYDAAKASEQKQFIETVNTFQQLAATVNNALNQAAENRMFKVDQEVAQNQRAIATQERLAEKGLKNTLAFEQKKQAELELQKQKEFERQQRREKVTVYYNALAAYLKENPPSAAAGKALAQVAIAEGVTALFWDGAENVGDALGNNGKAHTGKDGYRGIVGNSIIGFDGRERILGGEDSLRVPTWVTNETLADLGEAYAKGTLFTTPQFTTDPRLLNEVRRLNHTIAKLEGTNISIDWNKQGEVIETTVQNGMKKVIKHINSKPRIK